MERGAKYLLGRRSRGDAPAESSCGGRRLSAGPQMTSGKCTWLILVLFTARAQTRLELTVDTIMRGPQLAGYTPNDARWSGDGQHIYFRWKQYTDPPTKPL